MALAESVLSGTEKRPAAAISVVICVYTPARLPTLTAAVESLAVQTVAAHEVIVVVDHNDELLDEVRLRLPAVVAIAGDEDPGLSGARNTGLRAARGDVVAFLDDDAIAALDWIERLAAAYDDETIAGAGGAVVPLWEDAPPHWLPEEFHWVVGCSYRGLPSERGPVRNLIGCNMSFRRDAFAVAGGFSASLGRVGTRPLGCEETELCIRLAARMPGSELLYDPLATVHHHVPVSRASWRYFVARCYAEGASKAQVARLSGASSGLASERAHVLRTLPAGVVRELRRGRPRRAATIVAGLAITTAGYVRGTLDGARRNDVVEVTP